MTHFPPFPQPKNKKIKIHAFLNSVKSELNHTIPILDEIALDVGMVIVMREERVLRFVNDRVFKTRGNDLALQLLEGVQFMHRHLVAHLDLKPDNVLVAGPMDRPQLHITDFSVSVRVSKLESWIEGYRGTEEWVAPELKDDPDGSYKPIRADLWALGKLLKYIASDDDGGAPYPIRDLADKLMRHNSQQRPLLNSPIVAHYRRQKLEMKRKPVDEQENEGIKRRRLC